MTAYLRVTSRHLQHNLRCGVVLKRHILTVGVLMVLIKCSLLFYLEICGDSYYRRRISVAEKVVSIQINNVYLNKDSFTDISIGVVAEGGRLKRTTGIINAFNKIMRARRGEVDCSITTAKVCCFCTVLSRVILILIFKKQFCSLLFDSLVTLFFCNFITSVHTSITQISWTRNVF